jgi:hypothetical protein
MGCLLVGELGKQGLSFLTARAARMTSSPGKRKPNRLLTSMPTARSPQGRPAVERRVSTSHGSCSRIGIRLQEARRECPRSHSRCLEKFNDRIGAMAKLDEQVRRNGQGSSDATPQGWGRSGGRRGERSRKAAEGRGALETERRHQGSKGPALLTRRRTLTVLDVDVRRRTAT